MAKDARARRQQARQQPPDPDYSPDRRRSERFVASVPVGFRADGQARPVSTRTWDVGERGVCVRARKAVELGTRLELEIEVIMPTKVRLGFELDALVIDGPSSSHFARVPGVVRRCESCEDGTFDLGIEFCDDGDPEHLRIIDLYLDHLREGFANQFL